MAHARTHARTHARAHSHSQPQPDAQYPAAALVWLSARWLTARRHQLRGFQPECGLQPDLVFKEEAAARPGPGRRHWVVPCSCLRVAFSRVACSLEPGPLPPSPVPRPHPCPRPPSPVPCPRIYNINMCYNAYNNMRILLCLLTVYKK